MVCVVVTLIVNPFASRVSEERVRSIEQALGDVETLLTERRGHATELAREARGEAIYVYGGDGVVNEVLNGLERDVPVAIVPGGHTNVLARTLGVSRRPLEVGRPRRISLGRVNGRRFAFSAGIGVDSDAVRRLDTIVRNREGRRPGDIAYARVVAMLLLRGYEPRLEIEGLGRAAIALVSNSSVFTYAGPRAIRFLARASLELGLDLAAPELISPRTLPRLLARIAAGRGLEGARGVLAGHDLDRLVIRCGEPLPLEVDGEDLGDVTEAVFEAERDAISVLV
jgi:diacylglycerol kinase family enzyme